MTNRERSILNSSFLILNFWRRHFWGWGHAAQNGQHGHPRLRGRKGADKRNARGRKRLCHLLVGLLYVVQRGGAGGRVGHAAIWRKTLPRKLRQPVRHLRLRPKLAVQHTHQRRKRHHQRKDRRAQPPP